MAIAGALPGARGGGGGGGGKAIIDPIAEDQPFDLASRARQSALEQASKTLNTMWDGTAEKFTTFLVALRIRLSEARWDAAAPHGIISYGAAPNTNTPFTIRPDHRSGARSCSN